jgi:hypothetical protein
LLLSAGRSAFAARPHPLAPRTKPWRDAKMRHDPDDAKIGAAVAKSFSVRVRSAHVVCLPLVATSLGPPAPGLTWGGVGASVRLLKKSHQEIALGCASVWQAAPQSVLVA